MTSTNIPNLFVQVQAHFTALSFAGTQPICSWGFDTDAGFDPGLFGPEVGAWMNILLAPLSSQLGLNSVRVVVGADGGPPYVFQDYPTPGSSGTATGGVASPQTCALVKWSTSVPGRAGRGRTYLPGPSEDAVTNTGQLDPGFVTDMDAAVLEWRTETVSVGLGSLVILHPVGSPLAADPSVVTVATTEGQVATQRRRNRS